MSKSAAGETSPQTYTFAEVDSLQQLSPRPVVVFLHAEWCQFCRNMERSSLRQSEVVKLLADHYYFVSFDGESRNDILFAGQTFQFVPRGRDTGTHQLAAQLGSVDGQLVYPTLVLLNAQYEIVLQQQGYLTSGDLLQLLEL